MSRLAITLALALCAACDGLGRPLVDAKPATAARLPDRKEGLCAEPVGCEQDAAGVPQEVPPFDLGVCMHPGQRTWDLEDPLQTHDGEAAFCETLDWLYVGQPDATELPRRTLSGLHLSRANVYVYSDTALELTLLAPELERVWFELRGPIRLRVTAPVRFEQVRVLARSSAFDARLSLEDVRGEQLLVGAERGVALHFEAVRSALARAQVRAYDLLLDGSELDEAKLDANLVRVYGTSITASWIDGTIEADHALFESTRFGLRLPTTIDAWDSQIVLSRLCDHTRASRFAGSVFLACSSCDDNRAYLQACAAADTFTQLLPEDCPPLEELGPCTEPLARRRSAGETD